MDDAINGTINFDISQTPPLGQVIVDGDDGGGGGSVGIVQSRSKATLIEST